MQNTIMNTPILEELKCEVIEKLKDMAKFCHLMFNFYPEDELSKDSNYYENRARLVKLEKYQYINYEFEESILNVYIKKFEIWDDTIDEVDSSWVDETTLLQAEFNINELTADEIINQLLDKMKENNVWNII